jgi:hypothetical protein
LLSKPFFIATNFTKLFYFWKCEEKNVVQFSKNFKTFYPKNCQKYGFGIRDPEKTYSGSRIQGSKRHRIPDPDPQHSSMAGGRLMWLAAGWCGWRQAGVAGDRLL